ncbi:MAG TPA: hypothetical protein VNM15_04945 [Candidatus Binatia bacterium]|nr:hypothetical protein [Candidatus Binatia bacterium]
MTPAQILSRARRLGLAIAAEGDRLRVRYPKARTAEVQPLLDEIRRRKPELLAALAGESAETDAIDRLVDERAVAVLIDSQILGAQIWFALKEGWTPGPDDVAAPIFYASELPLLRQKTPEQLRSIFRVKAAFGPKTLVRQ